MKYVQNTTCDPSNLACDYELETASRGTLDTTEVDALLSELNGIQTADAIANPPIEMEKDDSSYTEPGMEEQLLKILNQRKRAQQHRREMKKKNPDRACQVVKRRPCTDPVDREETAFTRKHKACIRCRMQGIKV